METITQDELHARFKAQGVSSREHIAFKCPICSTVQSMASLVKAGASPETVENYIGFSCEGRFSGAGEWPASKDKGKKAVERRKVRGCNWTLGGLFQLHKLAVQMPDGEVHKSFEVASPDEAQALEAIMKTAAAA